MGARKYERGDLSTSFQNLMHNNGYKSESLCIKLDMSKSTLDRAIASDAIIKKKNLFEKLVAIIKEEKGYDPINKSSQVNEDIIPYGYKSTERIYIVPQKARAGFNYNAIDTDIYQSCPYLVIPWLRGKKCFAWEIDGDSMPPYKTGDIAIGSYIEHLEDVKDGLEYIIVTNDGVQLKEVRMHKKEIELISLNDKYKPEAIRKEEVKSIWKKEYIMVT